MAAKNMGINPLQKKLVEFGMDQALKQGSKYLNSTLNKKADQKSAPQPEPESPVVNMAESLFNKVFPEKNADGTPVTKSAPKAHDALARLSDIAASLEQVDQHQMIADIMLLVKESPAASADDKAEWTARLYGRRD